VENQIRLSRTKSDHVIQEVDELLRMGTVRRYVVALLPWLSLTRLRKEANQPSTSGVAGSRSFGGPGAGEDEEEMVNLSSARVSLPKGVAFTSVEPTPGGIRP